MTKIYELLNSKYIMDLDEDIPLMKEGSGWSNEYDCVVFVDEQDIYQSSDNYSVTTKEVYDQYIEECKDERYVTVELLWKDWKEILEDLGMNNESSRKLYRELM